MMKHPLEHIELKETCHACAMRAPPLFCTKSLVNLFRCFQNPVR